MQDIAQIILEYSKEEKFKNIILKALDDMELYHANNMVDCIKKYILERIASGSYKKYNLNKGDPFKGNLDLPGLPNEYNINKVMELIYKWAQNEGFDIINITTDYPCNIKWSLGFKDPKSIMNLEL